MPTSPPAKLPKWAEELAWLAVDLRRNAKHTMITVRFDGLAWQLFLSKPASRYVPLETSPVTYEPKEIDAT